MAVKQEIKTLFADLVASVGGTLGLFLGLSFLSFVELIGNCDSSCFDFKSRKLN